jgi:hypothetical protein
VPVRIANHIGRQLGMPPSLFIDEPARSATASEQAQRIREYLGCRPFDAAAQRQLKLWLADAVARGGNPEELLALTVTTLRAWKVEIPGRSTLERHISNALARAGQDGCGSASSRGCHRTSEMQSIGCSRLPMASATRRCSSSSSIRRRQRQQPSSSTSIECGLPQ